MTIPAVLTGDCRELMPPRGPFDLILADPPYGDKTATGKRSESWAQKLLDEPAVGEVLNPEGRLLIGHTKRDAVEITPPWAEHKTLKHGDTWIRVLTVNV